MGIWKALGDPDYKKAEHREGLGYRGCHGSKKGTSIGNNLRMGHVFGIESVLGIGYVFGIGNILGIGKVLYLGKP